jgi:hypothetical protein
MFIRQFCTVYAGAAQTVIKEYGEHGNSEDMKQVAESFFFE